MAGNNSSSHRTIHSKLASIHCAANINSSNDSHVFNKKHIMLQQKLIVKLSPAAHEKSHFIFGIPVGKPQRLHPRLKLETHFLFHENGPCGNYSHDGGDNLTNPCMTPWRTHSTQNSVRVHRERTHSCS
jgi:hypothetical protein